jgi:transposase InsO family protein
VHEHSRGTYGSPRIYQVLRRQGCGASENRIARLMRGHGIKARVATIRYSNPRLQEFFGTVRNAQLDLQLHGPDQVWVGDITYLKVGEVYRYLAVVMDKYSRRVLGWAYGKRKDVALTLRALERAVRYRRPCRGLIFHTDRGIEYAAGAFKARALELGIVQSMNRPGKLNDNAYIESFFHSMKSEIVHGLRFNEDDEVEQVVRAYIPFYNATRLHSSLNYVPPATFERLT